MKKNITLADAEQLNRLGYEFVIENGEVQGAWFYVPAEGEAEDEVQR